MKAFMSKPDEITELIIMKLAASSIEPTTNDFKKTCKIDAKTLEDQLIFLALHEVARVDRISNRNVVKKLSKLSEVVQAGGLGAYLEKEGKKEQIRLDKEQRDDKIKDLQLQELEVKMKYLENQFKAQNKFWTITIALSFIASIIALLKAFGFLASG